MIDPSEQDTADQSGQDTADQITTDELKGADVGVPPSVATVRVDVGARTHQGNVRKNNQDHYLVTRSGRYLHTLRSNLPDGDTPAKFDETGYISIVADGMGGAAGGETASRLAITTLIGFILHVPDWSLRLDDERAQKVMDRAASYYREVNKKLLDEARQKPELKGMGTTMTGTYSVGTDMFVIHVGDSRAYLFRDGELRRLTRDHTYVQRLVDAGVIKPEESGSHRLRHVLTNALGGGEDDGNAEIHRLRLLDGDRVLLCSDGLHDMVEDGQIGEILTREGSSDGACDALIDQALANGGLDNVTAVLSGYEIP